MVPNWLSWAKGLRSPNFPSSLPRKRKAVRRYRSVLRLELLEDRTVPSTIWWDGGAGTFNWSDAANWTEDRLPGPSDDVEIGNAFAGITVFSSGNSSVRSIVSHAGLTVSGGSLTVAAASYLHGPLTITATFGGSGDVYIEGLVTVSNGTLTGAGSLTAHGGTVIHGGSLMNGFKFINPAGRTVEIKPDNLYLVGHSIFENHGEVLLRGGVISLDGTGTIINTGSVVKPVYSVISGASIHNSGVIEVEAGGLLLDSPASRNTGSIHGAAATQVTFWGNMDSPGAIDLDYLEVSYGDVVNASGAFTARTVVVGGFIKLNLTGWVSGLDTVILHGHGLLDLSGGTLSADAKVLETLTISLGHLVTDEDLYVAGPFSWVSGTLQGVSGAGSLNVLSDMTLNGTNEVRDFHLINSASAVWAAGNVYFYGNSKFTNLAGASFDNSFDGFFGGADGTCPVFYNYGTFLKSGGAGTTVLHMQLRNSGVVQIDSGNLVIHCGLVLVTTINEGSSSSTGTISGNFTGSVSTTVVNPGDYTVDPAPAPPPPVTDYTQTSTGMLIAVIGGYAPGTQYGQIVVNNAVSLDGTLEVRLTNGFVPQVGDQFTIIVNNGGNPVLGHFVGLDDPEDIIWAGNYAFSVSYTGGDGNDVVLTMVKTAWVTPSGRVFDDRNNDGIFNGLDAGIAGVVLSLVNSANATVATTETDSNGYYSFGGFFGGDTYRIVAAQPIGYLDGKETAGSLGGTVDNTQDSDTIARITLNKADVGTDYNFAELRPSRIQGLVWEDANDDGDLDFGEKAIPGVEITLMGTDDRDQSVFMSLLTDDNGIYEFSGLRPGHYSIIQSQPAGFPDGRESLGTVDGVPVGTILNDRFNGVVLTPGSDAVNYNFGELVPLGSGIHPGQTATIAFWQSRRGQALIQSLNGGPNSTQLGNWLADMFPNMYGINAGANNLSGRTNSQVAAFYVQLYKRNRQDSPDGPPKLDAQVLATALSVYVTTESLAGTAGIAYGFQVTAAGVGNSTFNIGDNGAAFGVANNTIMTVLDILRATDRRTRNGILYDLDGNGAISKSEKRLRAQANEVYASINELGGIR